MQELFDAAEELGVEILMGSIPNCTSFSIPGFVALDYRLFGETCKERCAAAHELGHNARYAFYTRNDPPYIRRRCENKANKWAIKKLVPKDELEEAVSRGITEPWELAEYFDVTPEFMYMAMWYYENGNLALPRQMTGK